MLYRAHVYSLLATRDDGEFTVFFETYRSDASLVLHQLVAAAWDLPLGGVESYNCCSETELRAMWGGASAVSTRGVDSDTVLLQIGDGPDGPLYQAPARTMLLCSPRWHVRLAAAQEHLAREQRVKVGQKLLAAARQRAGCAMPAPVVLARAAAPRGNPVARAVRAAA